MLVDRLSPVPTLFIAAKVMRYSVSSSRPWITWLVVLGDNTTVPASPNVSDWYVKLYPVS